MRSSALSRPAFADSGERASGAGSMPPASSQRVNAPGQSAGDPATAGALDFEAVYAEHFAFVFRTVRGLGIPPAAVDDVTQDVFVIVHRKLSSLESASALKSWLFGIARRVCKDHRRAATRRGVQVSLDKDRDVDGNRDPQQQASTRQALRAIERFADSLDEERRALFFLAFVEGLPTAEVAEALELNPNTTYSRVRALRGELTALLESGEQRPKGNHG